MEKDLINRHLATGLPVHHIAVLDAALAQLPAPVRARDSHGRIPVLVRTDAAGATAAFAAHLHRRGVEFSVGASFAHLDVHGALASCRRPRGPRPTRPASRAPPSTACRSSPATGRGSPRPPG